MKNKIKYLLISNLLLICLVLNSQSKPIGTIKVGENIYFDQTEVDVGDWLTYYTWILQHYGLSAARNVLPDSCAIEKEVWKYINIKTSDLSTKKWAYNLNIGFFEEECEDSKKFKKRLNSVPGFCSYISFPITGLSYKQVIDFCNWRTIVLGENKIVYRLPTSLEWEYFALEGLSVSERTNGQKDSLYKNENCPLYNFRIQSFCDKYSYQGKLNGIGLYGPEETEAFDVFGNVSEMTSEEGIAKGGNFTLYANQCHPDSLQYYNKPEIWLGFRCIAVKGDIINREKRAISINNSSLNETVNGIFDFFADSRDGKNYPTVSIGNQVWFASNLAFKPDSGKYWAYDNDTLYVAQYGYLYSWETAKNVCPVGWHLPSKEEFETLLQGYGGAGNLAYKELRSFGSSGFSIIDCGLRYGIDFTPTEGGGTAFWSSTERNKRNVWGLGVGGLEPIVNLYYTYGKKSGLPVRCIKNQ